MAGKTVTGYLWETLFCLSEKRLKMVDFRVLGTQVRWTMGSVYSLRQAAEFQKFHCSL